MEYIFLVLDTFLFHECYKTFSYFSKSIDLCVFIWCKEYFFYIRIFTRTHIVKIVIYCTTESYRRQLYFVYHIFSSRHILKDTGCVLPYLWICYFPVPTRIPRLFPSNQYWMQRPESLGVRIDILSCFYHRSGNTSVFRKRGNANSIMSKKISTGYICLYGSRFCIVTLSIILLECRNTKTCYNNKDM